MGPIDKISNHIQQLNREQRVHDLKWDLRFIDEAWAKVKWSKDPSTGVGAVLVRDRHIISTGYNGFPVGIEDSEERLNNREVKYNLVVHAELNCVLRAARFGIATGGATLYVVAGDKKTGKAWGGAPCIRCSVELIQSGIVEVVAPKPLDLPNRWKESCDAGAAILREARVHYREVEWENK